MKPRTLSQDECASILSSSKFGRLGLSSDDNPYVIPMSFVYCDGKIYLHSRGRGRKIEVVIKNSRVCFEVDQLNVDRWVSVIAFGKARLSSDIETKTRMFDAFIKKGIGGHGDKKFQREELERMEMTIWEIEVVEMAGREGIW
jgi:nitroimidazol reductase NimA-like FMN-containing flavoprotein (pyridoxamine 5'-phosphate oxidase superfamily)